jgi:hypothetical protein
MKLFTREELQRKDIDTLKRHLRQKIGGYGVAISNITTANLLYRGVKCDERPTKVSRISYAPAHCITKNGRLNRAGTSMFYCSRGAPAVFFEVHAKQGERIALSKWKITEPLWMHNVGYHADALERMGAPVGPRAQFVNPIPNETKFNERLRRALSLAFTENVSEKNEYRYKLSIAMNELLFDGAEPMRTDLPDGPRDHRAAGTVYPAMGMRGVADNVAIWPEFVDRYLRIQLVQWVLIETADEVRSCYTVQHLATAREFPDGNIVWDETPMAERTRRGTIALENGRWVSRDGLNQVYDLH